MAELVHFAIQHIQSLSRASVVLAAKPQLLMHCIYIEDGTVWAAEKAKAPKCWADGYYI